MQILLLTLCQLLGLFDQIFKQILWKFLFQLKNNDSFVITATDEGIFKIISSLNVSKSSGPNSTPTKILHLVWDQVSKYLGTICNLTFSLFWIQLK